MATPFQVTRQEIVDAAMSLRGVRFRHQGRSRETGVDCAGMLAVVLEAIGFPHLIDIVTYRSSPPASLIRETLEANLDEIPISEVGLGDIYLMRLPTSSKPKHISILVSDENDPDNARVPTIIHAYGLGGAGRVITEPLAAWQPRCVSAFRVRGLVT